MSWLLLMLGLAVADEADATIEVLGSTDIEVYVAPIEVMVSTQNENIEAEIDPSQAFAYSSRFWHNAQVKNDRGIYEPVKLNHEKIYIYSEDTIQYAWQDCNYKLKPMECSMQNGHFYLETTVHVDDNELVVRAILFDHHAQVIAMGTSTDRRIIRWIKQQTTVYPNRGQVTTQPACQSGTSCAISGVSTPNGPTSQTTLEKPKEEMPLQWSIPHSLTNKHIHQAMLLMWASTKMDLD